MTVLSLVLLWAAPATAFYNPQTGRWLTRDPLQEEGSANLHIVASNNPINAFDPLGLLTYTSEGRVYYDGPGGYTFGITWQVTRSAS